MARYSNPTYHSGKFRRLVGREHFVEKLSQNVKPDRIMGVICLKFSGENFCGSLKNREIIFFLESFPLAMWYRVCELHRHEIKILV